jgi:hypothetical protein
MIPAVNKTYMVMHDEETDSGQKEQILKAHRNFLRQAIYSLYVYNRIKDAANWYKILGEQYPNKTIVDGDMNSFPRNLTLDQYAVACIQQDINDTSRDGMRRVLEGLLINCYTSLIIDQDERAAGLKHLARQAWEVYQKKVPADRMSAIGLPPFEEVNRDVLNRMLDPENGLPPEARAILRTKLNLPAEKAVTAAPSSGASTNAP